MKQPFDKQGNMLCIGCQTMIGQDDFYLEVQQRDSEDLAVHVGCLIHLEPMGRRLR